MLPKALARYRQKVASLGDATFRPADLPAAQRDLAALLNGSVRVIEDDGEPVAELRLSAGTLISLALGRSLPAETWSGSGGRI